MIEPTFLAQGHFAVGTFAIVAGFAAFLLPKGRRAHRAAGTVFFVCMIILCASGLWLSLSRSILFTIFLSGLALHLVVTGWAAIGRETRTRSTIRRFSGAFALLLALGSVVGARRAAANPSGMIDGLPPDAFHLIAAVSALLLLFDLAFALSPAPSRRRRIWRHTGRMGFSMLIATAIFFFGNNHVLPPDWRTEPILSAPVLAVCLLTLVFLLRTALGRGDDLNTSPWEDSLPVQSDSPGR